MSTNTETLELFKYDSATDASSNFNIKQALNDNWDKLDANAESVNTNFDNINKDYVRMPGVGVATASGNNYSVSTDPAPTAYIDNIGIIIRAQSASTGAATLNWNSLGAKALKKSNGEDVSLKQNAVYFFRYSTATGNFIMVNEIPTKVSQLTNDSEFITADDIPTSLPASGGHASTADKWQTARNIALSGDVTGNTSVNGSADASIATTLKNSGVTAGTYRSVTVDAKGRVTAGTKPSTRDDYGLTDVYTKSESDSNYLNYGVIISSGQRTSKMYKKLVTLPRSSSEANDSLFNLFGSIGGWTSSTGKASINLVVANRDSDYFVGNMLGSVNNVDIEVYKEDDTTFAIYAVLYGYVCNCQLFYTGSNYTIVNGSETTTAPTGTLKYRLSRDANMQVDSNGVKSNGSQVVTQDDILNLGTTSNSGNVYTVSAPSGFTLKDGQLLVVKFNAASTGNITLNVGGTGAKPVKDYFGNNVNNVRANLPCNLIYESSSGSFILLGKGGDGDATAPDILEGKTATVSSGVITGTMPNNPLKTPIVSIPYVGVDAGASDYGTIYVFIPKGAYLESASGKNSESAVIIPNTNIKSENLKSGITFGNITGKSTVVDTADADAVAGDVRDGKTAYVNSQKVTGSCPVQATAAQEVVPGTSDIVKPAGIYDGDITIKGIQPSDIGGRKYATGHKDTGLEFSGPYTVSSLTFKPSIIFVKCYYIDSSNNYIYTLYNTAIEMLDDDGNTTSQIEVGAYGSDSIGGFFNDKITNVDEHGFTYNLTSSRIKYIYWLAVE